MKLARVIGRVFCSRQAPKVDGMRLLLLQPLDWDGEKPVGDPIVAADATGSGSSEKVYFVAARDAAHAFKEAPPVDAAVVGVVEGHQVGHFRGSKSGQQG
jgi:ethanolamine utilization protein EutN